MFYIHPPEGQVALHTLEECVLTRLEYLELLYDQKSNEFSGNFEYLLECSVYDRIGHFTLRLLTASSSDFFSYWLTREKLLFKYRLNQISPRQLCRLFKSITKQLKRRDRKENSVDVESALLDVSLHYLQTDVFYHITDKNHSNECRDYCLKVDFQLLPKMVQNREVELSNGYAIVFCSQWREVLLSLFQTFIESEAWGTDFAMESVLTDPRLISLNRKLQFRLLKEGVSCGQLSASNLEVESLKFPPCMKNLQSELRRNHRLSHYARFYYSLFLKECGMKLEDAVDYWKEEYSKPQLNASICSHKWQKDAKKFTYGIRHMYGLEGSRKNYQAPNCNAICMQNVGPNFEGGCPFKEFDKRTLKRLLSSSLAKSDLDVFLETASRMQPKSACTAYLKLTRVDVEDVTVTSPVQFYLARINPS